MQKRSNNKPAHEIPSNNNGFTLIEVIVALAVMTIGILSVNAMQTASIRGNFTANNITTASAWATDKVEEIFGMDYGDLTDQNGDGIRADQDNNNNGIDDDEEGGAPPAVDNILNFGLDQNTVATADYNATSVDTDAKYTIMWNVAENVPIVDTKTVHVIVTWKEGGRDKFVTLMHKKTKYL
jgi:prepilin-type N-terminal cleavage/methylation domain-containing protein